MSVVEDGKEEELETPDAYVAYSETGTVTVSDSKKILAFLCACQVVMCEIHVCQDMCCLKAFPIKEPVGRGREKSGPTQFSYLVKRQKLLFKLLCWDPARNF